MRGVFVCVALLVLCCVAVHAAINPRRELRVLMIHTPWGNIEEPASVAASMLGIIVSVINFFKMRKLLARLPKGSWMNYPAKSLWFCTLYGVGAMSVSSVLFHAHDDHYFTEGLDYTTAIWFIGFMSCASFMRCFRIYKTITQRVTAYIIILIPLCCHSTYMFFFKWDYGWNMKFGSFFVAVTLVMWYGFCAYYLLFSKPPVSHFKWALAGIAALTAFAPAEIWDFIPIWQTIDGHSVWHVGMDLFGVLFAEFVMRDVEYFASKESDPLMTEQDFLHKN